MSKHRFHAPGDVPFAWESKPGMSKVAPHAEELPKAAVGKGKSKLPLPPCPRESPRLSGHGLYIPLPPCPFQDPKRISYRRSGWEDDPFLAAYMECTGSGKDQRRVAPKQKKTGGGIGLRSEMFGLSCKSVRDVVEDGVVRLSRRSSVHLREWNTVGKRKERDPREHRSLIHEWSSF